MTITWDTHGGKPCATCGEPIKKIQFVPIYLGKPKTEFADNESAPTGPTILICGDLHYEVIA